MAANLRARKKHGISQYVVKANVTSIFFKIYPIHISLDVSFLDFFQKKNSKEQNLLILAVGEGYHTTKYFDIPIFLEFFQVSWIRKRDSHILTVDGTTFISDERFYILKPERRHVWTLRIRYVMSPAPTTIYILCYFCMQ